MMMMSVDDDDDDYVYDDDDDDDDDNDDEHYPILTHKNPYMGKSAYGNLGQRPSNDGYHDYVLPIPSPTHFLGNHVNDGVDFGDNDHKRLIESL